MTTRRHSPDAPPADDSIRPLLVDIVQAASILAVSRSSMYQLIWRGEITPVRVGRSVRFSITDLEQFVADRSAAD